MDISWKPSLRKARPRVNTPVISLTLGLFALGSVAARKLSYLAVDRSVTMAPIKMHSASTGALVGLIRCDKHQ